MNRWRLQSRCPCQVRLAVVMQVRPVCVLIDSMCGYALYTHYIGICTSQRCCPCQGQLVFYRKRTHSNTFYRKRTHSNTFYRKRTRSIGSCDARKTCMCDASKRCMCVEYSSHMMQVRHVCVMQVRHVV
jgi:hypothetical protein